jgi:hypothetical protein
LSAKEVYEEKGSEKNQYKTQAGSSDNSALISRKTHFHSVAIGLVHEVDLILLTRI